MNKEIIESITDYFKDKYSSLIISTDNFECYGYYHGIINFAQQQRQQHESNIVRIARMWFEFENINLYLYDNHYNSGYDPLKTIHYQWDINDPKCITEIEEHIEKHISHIE